LIFPKWIGFDYGDETNFWDFVDFRQLIQKEQLSPQIVNIIHFN